MKNGIHFISGLPRSGSTLLSALLRQNPLIHAGMSSPVSGLCQRLTMGMGPQGEFSSFITDQQRVDILQSVFMGYYKDLQEERTIIDTSRMWCARMPLLAELFPEARVIVCVRQLLWVVDSFEKILQKNPLVLSKMFPQQSGSTVFSRAASLGAPNGIVGYAWNALQEAFYGNFANRLILIDYEAMTRNPKGAMEFIYRELGLPLYEHDFENVTYSGGDEFDQELGLKGLHAVGRTVRFVERPSILPPALVRRYAGTSFWRRPGSNLRNVKMFLPDMTDRPQKPTQGWQGGRQRSQPGGPGLGRV